LDGLTCDCCDAGLLLDADVRYVVKIEGFAAYDPLELTQVDLERDLETEMQRTIEQLEAIGADAAQSQVHRAFSFDLCSSCWRRYAKNPLAGLRPSRDSEWEGEASEGGSQGGQGDDDGRSR